VDWAIREMPKQGSTNTAVTKAKCQWAGQAVPVGNKVLRCWAYIDQSSSDQECQCHW
jgi:hypothetical protein